IIAADLTGAGTRTYGLGRPGASAGTVAVRAASIECRPRLWRRLLSHELNVIHPGHDVSLDVCRQLTEHLEGFVLVLDERIALTISMEPDPLSEVLHLGQVVDPFLVDGLQHDEALETPEPLFVGCLLLFRLICLNRGVVQQGDDRLATPPDG